MRAPLSQHFLRDERALAHMAKQLDLKGKEVLEIGAGHGELTRHLAQRAKKVVALEKDPRLCGVLRENLSGVKNVQIVCADALAFDLSPHEYFAGNLPYSISSPLLFRVLETNFHEALFLLQKEFAQRLTAGPGTREWSRLSVMAQSKAEMAILGYLGPELFEPPPRVESALVLLKRKRKPVELSPRLVNLLFQHKNQSARNALGHSAKALGLPKKEARALAEKLPHSQKRVRDLTLQELQEMGRAFEPAGKTGV